MSDLRSLSRNFLTEFIELYQAFPCLWKTKSKEYIDRNKKNEAYKVLLAKLQEVDKSASKETVKSKINTLRSGFRRELKKILRSQRSGAGADDVYSTNLWYYDLFYFIKDQEIPPESVTNALTVSDNENYSQHLSEQQNDEEESGCLDDIEESATVSIRSVAPSSPSDCSGITETSTSIILPNTSTPNTSKQSTVKKTTKKRKSKPEPPPDQADDILTMVGERLRTSSSDDQFSVFGKNVAMKLKGLQREARLYAERLINEVLFEAEMGNINRDARIVTSLTPLQSNHHYQVNVGSYLPHTSQHSQPNETSLTYNSDSTPHDNDVVSFINNFA